MGQLIRKYENVDNYVIEIPKEASISMIVPLDNTVELNITKEPDITATVLLGNVVFSDDNPDTITRQDGGSFVDDGFASGMRLEVSNSTSNNAIYTIDNVSEKVITLDAGDSLTDETDNDVTLYGFQAAGDFWYRTCLVSGYAIFEKFCEYGPNYFRVNHVAGNGDITIWVKS